MKKKYPLKDLVKKERKIWEINPVERVKENKKIYNRKKRRDENGL